MDNYTKILLNIERLYNLLKFEMYLLRKENEKLKTLLYSNDKIIKSDKE